MVINESNEQVSQSNLNSRLAIDESSCYIQYTFLQARLKSLHDQSKSLNDCRDFDCRDYDCRDFDCRDYDCRDFDCRDSETLPSAYILSLSY